MQLSYIDKFLTAIQMEFRNKYKDDLQQGQLSRNFDFSESYHSILRDIELASKKEAQAPR